MSTFHQFLFPYTTSDAPDAVTYWSIYRTTSEVTDLDPYVSAPWALNAEWDDLSGPSTSDRIMPDFQRNLADEDEYVSVDYELNALDAWHDKAPEYCTLTLEQHQARPDVKEARITPDGVVPATSSFANVIEPEVRQAYVENNEAFLSLHVLDYELTKKYHSKLLNWFINKQGQVQIGSMLLGINENGERYAQCVRACCKDSNGNWYKPGVLIDRFATTREDQETLIYTLIQHGNNCAPNWLRQRPDFYKLHNFGCDLNHSATQGCNNNSPSKGTEETFNEVEFLFDHQTYCTESRCKCSEYLAALVPALVKETA